MMCTAYFGKISEKNNWNHSNGSPYDILESSVELFGKGHDLLQCGDRYFNERIQVDWGSFAWKCSEQGILKFLNDNYNELPWLKEREDSLQKEVKQYIEKHGNIVYGVVFIELC